MRRSRFGFLILVPFAISALGAAATLANRAGGAQASSRSSRPPNIVYVLADDLNVEVYSHMDRLKALLNDKGTTFANHFVSLSLCCPSRTATLRGQYAHNTRIFTNAPPGGGFEKVLELGLEDSTMATWLHDAGYRTVLMGKYLNGYPNGTGGRTYIPPGWDEWYSPVHGNPYSEYNYDLNENGAVVPYGDADSDYMVDVLANKAVDFIERSVTADPSTPFFMYIATYAPHGPATVAPRYIGRFTDATAPRTASFNEPDVSSKPDWVRLKAPLTTAQIAGLDVLYRKRLGSMLAVEDLVANVIDKLTALGQLENTYIVFTSDNGFHQGQHRLNSGKNTGYDEDLFVPMVIRGPGVPAGRTLPHFTLNVDFAPTFAALGGATPDYDVDGRSLVPLLSANPPPLSEWRRAILLEHAFPGDGGPRQGSVANGVETTLEPKDPAELEAPTTAATITAPGVAPVFQGIRTRRFKYIDYVTGERELYDVRAAPAGRAGRAARSRRR